MPRNAAGHLGEVVRWLVAPVVAHQRALLALNVLYFMLLDEPWTVGAEDEAPFGAKVMAASAIFLWIGVLFFGHMLPFLGNA